MVRPRPVPLCATGLPICTNGLEDPRLIVPADADPGILHAERERQPSGAIGGSRIQAKSDRSLFRVLDGVVQQVDQHLAELGRIGADVTRKFGGLNDQQ